MQRLRVALAGVGAFGARHLEALRRIDGVDVTSLIGGDPAGTREAAARYGVAHATTQLDESLARPDVDAVVLCTPTPLHAAQALACLDAGKHVLVEIPLADSLAGARAVAERAHASGLVAMCGHTRRFNPSHQWIHRRVESKDFRLAHLDVQTFFLRRTNTNALGAPRSWTDHLLWHHAAHTVDLFAWQSGGRVVEAHAVQGPPSPTLGIAMDMSIQLASSSGAICTLALSFNNDGPIGSFFRYIGDSGTYVARYDDLFDGRDAAIDVSAVDVSTDGVELQDREFVAAIRERRPPRASVAEVLPCYEVLDRLERSLQRPRP